jgi:hypothetical protein
MNNVRGVLLTLPVFALLQGCPIWTDERGGSAGCSRDADCPLGMLCDARGRCVTTGTCDRDADCGAGMICEAGTCTFGTRLCRTHADCAPGEFCMDGQCTPSGTCAGDEDCASGFWCDHRGTCVPRPENGCRTHADCSAGRLCIENYCRAVGETCQFDRDCRDGVCLNNECTTLCATDADCAPGDACRGGYCRAASDPDECTSSASCGLGEHCVDGRCLRDCREGATACDERTYCQAEDQFCHPSWAPVPFCSRDSDCRSGRICLRGVCRTPCTDDASCQMLEAMLPNCRVDGASGMRLCFANNELTPGCRVQADCGEARDCIDGVCRNRR